MRQFTIPTFSPDGFGGSLAPRQRDVVADAHSLIAAIAAASRAGDLRAAALDETDRYDDGLVHGHGWASSAAR